jgi:Leucine-rich repeat (LRR) protein
MVSLAKNSIKALKRGWFAEDLPKLWSLDLSHNKISEMESDFFNGMPALRRLRLDNNELKEIYLVYFLVSDRNLNEFSIESKSSIILIFNDSYFCEFLFR